MAPEPPRRSLHALPPGTALHDYVIESELGSGGFSIVYLARHRLNPGWRFAVKEYFPRELVAREHGGAGVQPHDTLSRDAFDDGLRRFRDEAGQLRRFRNEPHIVSCLNYFEANGTAYLVMDHDDGLPLSEFLERREAAGWPFTEEDLLAVVEPLLEGLAAVHRAGVLHRDIKPGNIFVRRENDVTGRPAQPVLIDFGAAKQNYLERHSRSRAPYTPGYAAYEQVSSMGEVGPPADIYAVGAVMWRMVAGGCPGHPRLLVEGEPGGAGDGEPVWNPAPREVEQRAYALLRGRPDPMPPAAELGAGRFSPHVLESIDRCLAQYPDDRVRDCGELSELLRGRRPERERPGSEPTEVPSQPDSTQDGSRGVEPAPDVSDKLPTSDKRLSRWWLGAAVPLVILAVGAIWFFPGADAPPAPERSVDDAIAAFERGDYGVAFQEFRNFADQGHVDAQIRLALMYAFGLGAPRDDAEAARWYRLAAEQGHVDAQKILGMRYANGAGVPENSVESYAWLSIAEAQGDSSARDAKGTITTRMTQSQIEAAQELSREYWNRYVVPFQ